MFVPSRARTRTTVQGFLCSFSEEREFRTREIDFDRIDIGIFHLAPDQLCHADPRFQTLQKSLSLKNNLHCPSKRRKNKEHEIATMANSQEQLGIVRVFFLNSLIHSEIKNKRVFPSKFPTDDFAQAVEIVERQLAT